MFTRTKTNATNRNCKFLKQPTVWLTISFFSNSPILVDNTNSFYMGCTFCVFITAFMVVVLDNSICVQHRVVAMFISDRQSFGKFEPSSGGPFHPVSSDSLPLPHPGQRMFGFKKVAFCLCVECVSSLSLSSSFKLNRRSVVSRCVFA